MKPAGQPKRSHMSLYQVDRSFPFIEKVRHGNQLRHETKLESIRDRSMDEDNSPQR